MDDFFIFLVENNIITVAFILGALALFIAIIGGIKSIIEPSPTMRIVLALFGLFLMLSSVGGYTLERPRNSEVTSTPVIDSIQEPVSTQVDSSPTAPQSTFEPTPTVPSPTIESIADVVKSTAMDDLFGVGNWFCFPDRETGVGVKRLSSNFNVQPPLRYIDNWLGRFALGESTSQAAGATVELDKRLPREECPSFQQAALADWSSARASNSQAINRERFDDLFGTGNWQCLPDFTFGIRVNYLSDPIVVQYPFTVIDGEDSTRYGVGETAPGGGGATVWLGGSISQDQCP